MVLNEVQEILTSVQLRVKEDRLVVVENSVRPETDKGIGWETDADTAHEELLVRRLLVLEASGDQYWRLVEGKRQTFQRDTKFVEYACKLVQLYRRQWNTNAESK